MIVYKALALSIMAGALPGTPHDSLDQLANIPNLIEYLRGEAAKGASRLHATQEWTGETAPTGPGIIRAHSTISNNYISELSLPKAESDRTTPNLILDRGYNLIFPSTNETLDYRANLSSDISSIPIHAITCYTDGSKTSSGTGYGYYTTTNSNATIIKEHSTRLPDYCSVYQAELSAIADAATSLQHISDSSIYFLTDSLSSIHTLNNKVLSSKTALSCHKALNVLSNSNTVHVLWIEAHSGHQGNEKADSLAKAGTTSSNLATGYLPYSYIKDAINRKVMQRSAHIWHNSKHKHTQLTFGPRSKSTSKDLTRLLSSRNDYRIAIQLITGHAALNYHLHKMRLVDSSLCPLCEYDEETVGHFVGQCPALAGHRGRFFNTYYASLSEIFENHSIDVIVKYANSTKRLIIKDNDPQQEPDQGPNPSSHPSQ